MKQIIRILLATIPFLSTAQYEGNTTLNYPDLIAAYEKLVSEHEELELYAMGDSDYGLPIYLCVINGAGDSLQTFTKARRQTTVLINNAIHPGEPDGVNACLMWIDNWIKSGKKTEGLPVIGIIPAYNVGGMMNRSGTSRANQDGPEEYGFRGNSQNLDLNRDFIKMDSKNMFTFAKIYQGLDPDVFIDTHVSNGADYQYTMTYIASVRERMAPSLGDLLHDDMIPSLKKVSASKGFDLIPYVDLKGDVPEKGIRVFNDLPRYAMGYASLMGAMSFTTETHMLKPFPDRVKSTLTFLEAAIEWTGKNQGKIEHAREEAQEWELEQTYFRYNYKLTNDSTTIEFKGYEHSYPKSEVTGLKRLKYNRKKPWTREVSFWNKYVAKDSLVIPDYYVIGGQCTNVIERLKANGVVMIHKLDGFNEPISHYKIASFKSGSTPYEGHFLHREVEKSSETQPWKLKNTDYFINPRQKNMRFIISVLEPETEDSYFAWNFFDSYVQQKEYFSPYVFEDKAVEILKSRPELKKQLEEMREKDPEFAKSSWRQLYFIYQHSEFYEPSHNSLPVGVGKWPELKSGKRNN